MQNLDTTQQNTDYTASGRFFPVLDIAINDSDFLRKRTLATKVLLKSYAMAASGGSHLEICKCSRFSQQMVLLGQAFNAKPSLMAACFHGTNTERKQIDPAITFEPAEHYRSVSLNELRYLPYSEKVIMSTRAGLAGLLMGSQVHPFLVMQKLDLSLREFLYLPSFQFACLGWLLDAQLKIEKGNIVRAVAAVRKEEDSFGSNTFAKNVWKMQNRLLASGHDLRI